MAKVNKTQFIILGFLVDRPLSGYELREVIKQSTAFFWQESDASIYPTLKFLAREGKVTSQTVLVGKRKKEVFSITPLGKKSFAEWFVLPPAPSIQRDEFLLKLFFTTEQTEEEMHKHYEHHQIQLQSILNEYKNIESMVKREFPHKPFWIKTVQNGIAHAEAELAWLKQQD